MLTLMIKDARQTMWPALLATLFLLAPPITWLSFALSDDSGRPHWQESRHELMGACFLGAVASLIAASSITGVAFAKERRERTADLLATLPVPRWKVVLSKALVALTITAVPFAIGVLACAALADSSEYADFRLHGGDSAQVWSLALVAVGWLTLFGLGWGLSSIIRSEVLSAALPLVVLIVVPSAIALWGRPLPDMNQGRWRSQEERLFSRYVRTLAPLGLAGLAVGTVVALRRKSP